MEDVTDKTAAASATGGGVTSGTASEAMIKAASAASSAAPGPDGQAGAGTPKAGAVAPGATPAATVQATATPPPAAAAGTGEAPQSRIEAAVKNARAEMTAEFDRQYGWAKNLNPNEVSEAVNWLRRVRANPGAFHKQLGQEIEETGGAPESYDLPKPDYTSEDGGGQFYSASAMQKALEIQERKIMAKVNQTLEPITTERQQQQLQQQEQQQHQQRMGAAREAITTARQLEHFSENEADILATLETMTPEQKRNPLQALYTAYNHVMKTKVYPGLRTKIEEEVRQGNQRKVGASIGSTHPAAAAGSGQKPELRNVSQLAEHMRKLNEASQ